MSALKVFAGVTFAVTMTAVAVQGCSSKKDGIDGDDDSSSSGGGSGGSSGSNALGDDTTSSSGITFSSGSSSGSGVVVDNGPCKGGHYEGTFAGVYDSHITVIGFGIPVVGDVQLNLQQEGDGGTCVVEGELPKPCNDVFTLQNGTIDGTADQGKIGDAAAFGGFPYHCDMTGTLECSEKKLVNGWITCTYCIGPIEDSGHACTIGNGVGGTTGTGGHFAGPLIANYDTGSLSFVMGTWNGAEALCTETNSSYTCNDGSVNSPGPDGGPWQDYIQDAGYFLGAPFGGSGTWNATWQK